MKSILKKLSLTLIIICVFNSYLIAQTDLIDSSYKSFNVLSNNPSVDKGFWEATITDDEICIRIIGEKEQSYIITKCFDKADFNFSEENTSFELDRIQGKLSFTGEIKNNSGEGEFTFNRNKEFEGFLEKEDISHSNEIYYFKLFLSNINKDYVIDIKQLDYEPTIVQLGRLAYHNVTYSYIEELHQLNYSIEDITRFAMANIQANYIKSLSELDFNNLEAWQIKKAKMLGITADFIKKSIKKGHVSDSLEDYIILKKKGKFLKQ